MNFFPNAKINLGLNITEKRTDGFHNLESVFVPVLWNDELEIIDDTPSDEDSDLDEYEKRLRRLLDR